MNAVREVVKLYGLDIKCLFLGNGPKVLALYLYISVSGGFGNVALEPGLTDFFFAT